MGNNIDWKKLIQMVAIIGVLCLFVGVATRLIQKSQTSLNDYAKKNPEIAYAVPEEEPSSDATDSEIAVDKENPANEFAIGSKTEKDSKTGNESDGSEITAQDIYDNFYYTDEADGYKFHLMYYTSKHEVSTAELEFNAEDPDEALSLFYDLFKAGHEFTSITDLQKFADKLSVKNDDETETNAEAEAKGEKDEKAGETSDNN